MAFTCCLSDMSWSMITPRFLTLVLGFMSIPTTFNETIMTLEHCLPVPAIKNSVFSSFSLSRLFDIQLLVSAVHKWSFVLQFVELTKSEIEIIKAEEYKIEKKNTFWDYVKCRISEQLQSHMPSISLRL